MKFYRVVFSCYHEKTCVLFAEVFMYFLQLMFVVWFAVFLALCAFLCACFLSSSSLFLSVCVFVHMPAVNWHVCKFCP